MDPQMSLFIKAIHRSERRGDGKNPFSPFIEAMTSVNTWVLEKVDGEYPIRMGMPSSFPDTILTDAQKAVQDETLLSPGPPPLLSRDDILEDYGLLCTSPGKSEKPVFRQMIAIQPPQFVRSPLESLTPVLISGMMLHKVHKQNYLICRAISRAARMIAVQVAVEDVEGNVADLALYNTFETAGLDSDGVAGIIPVGQAMLVREPWFKLGATGGNPTVRVDTPSDIIFLEFSHPMLRDFPTNWRQAPSQDVEEYRLLGNEAFKKNHLEAAVRAYTTGLAINPHASLLYLNRSLCYLKLGSYSLALKDARIASEDENLPALTLYKAQYRIAAILYGMERFTQALEVLRDEAIVEFSPEDVHTLQQKTQARLLEQTQGNYDWAALRKLADEVNGSHSIPDVADYIGPIKVASMRDMGGGRGLVAARPVVAGELLLVSKPFAFASPLEFPERLRALNLKRSNITERAYIEVIGRAARRLTGDHTAASALFLDLYPGGDYVPATPLGTDPATPKFLANGACYWNILEDHPVLDLDINRVEGIIASNSFSDSLQSRDLGKTEGVYSLPSLMNHSCHGSAIRFQIGSIVIIRASRDMKEGEEITCSYMGIGEHDGATYLTREHALKKWIDGCRCQLCSSDRLDGISQCEEREQRNKELAEIRMQPLHPAHTQFATTIRNLVPKIRSTYRTGRKEPMDTLGLAQRVLAFMSQQNPRQAIQLYTDALRSHGIAVKTAPPKRVPRKRSDIRRNALIIETSAFPSQSGTLFRCLKVMGTIATLEYHYGKRDAASHWAIACLWTHELYYGPGKQYLWHKLSINDPSGGVLGELLKEFE